MTDNGKARHLGRRKGVRLSIPKNVRIPKFLTPNQVEDIIRMKTEMPNATWAQVISWRIEDIVHEEGHDRFEL